MAIVLRGKTQCALCGHIIQQSDAVRAFPAFIADQTHPLWRFSDAAFHSDCFEHWPERQRFLELLSDVLPSRGHDRSGGEEM